MKKNTKLWGLWGPGPAPSWLAVEIVMFFAWVMVVVYWALNP